MRPNNITDIINQCSLREVRQLSLVKLLSYSWHLLTHPLLGTKMSTATLPTESDWRLTNPECSFAKENREIPKEGQQKGHCLKYPNHNNGQSLIRVHDYAENEDHNKGYLNSWKNWG